MWLRSVLLICGVIACTLADNPSSVVRISGDNLTRAKNLAVTTYQPPRAISIEEFVSRKLPGNVAKSLDEDDEYIDERKVVLKDNKPAKKVIQKFENTEKKAAALEPVRRLDSAEEDDLESLTDKRQARVELENFSDTGKLLQEERIKKVERPRPSEQDEVIPGVYVSAEYPTTMLPVLTTPREARGKDSPFDFVPVNIIREDSKDGGYARFSDANFGDLSDVSLVPAGTNSRIQVKKGPNGKDYEYEYVYYYYDEEDENKAGTAGSAVTNSYDIPSRTTAAPRRGGTAGNRSKYNTVERSSTVEPSNNEVIPNRNGNRGRQLVETEDNISEERLPANTRFPPRSRSNHNTGTTESSRARSNRPRPSLDLVDSSSFRTHQEGPEFPQTLPKGPVRFLGVTPNEDNEDKPLVRNRGRPQRVQEPAPVEEIVDDAPAPATRRRPSTAAPETGVELSRGQPTRPSEEDDEEEIVAPERSSNKRISLEDKVQDSSETEASLSSSTTADTTDNPTTEYPVMDKVALDLYAFLQQGQSNLIDASSSEASETGDSTTLPEDEITTDLATTTELATTIVNESASTTTTTTTTTTEPTTTTTTTTEPPTTTTQVPVPGRGKFRRPGIGGIGGPAISRNRFKSNGGTSTTEAPAPESTQRTRGRFGSGSGGGGTNGGGFKRPRPGGNHKPIEEDTVQKESSSSANAEKPAPGRGRFRAPTGGRIAVSTTTSAPSSGSPATSNGAAAAARPAFNKVNINRRRGRPTTAAPGGEEPPQEAAHSETGQTAAQNAQTDTTPGAPKSAVRARLPGTPAIRPGAIRPGGRVNLRQKPGQTTTTTTLAPEAVDASVEEPAGEGTEEETHEAPAETSPPARATTSNPLNKLRNRNRLQVHPKTTTKSPLQPAIRRSPLLPRRKVTEAPAAQTSQEDVVSEEEAISGETEATEATSAETSTAASTKHEETRGLGGLLAPRRRIPARRPGQITARE